MHAHLLMMLLALASIFSCKSKPPSTGGADPENLVIGHGGGFTGQIIEYQIFETGKVLRRNSLNNSEEEIKSIPVDSYKQIISNYQKLGLDQLDWNEPDNMYYYIVFNQEGNTHKVVWNNNNESEVQAKLKLFFNTVLHRVKV